MNMSAIRGWVGGVGFVVLMFGSNGVFAHGGVEMEGGQCLIRIGNLEARFTGYQPATRGSKEFCDDLPDLTGSIFVLEFVHDVLKIMPLDFRIIRDEKKFGLSATPKDIKSLKDIGSMTEYYSPAIRYDDGSVKIQYEFLNPGIYIGIITVQHPVTGIVSEAVFPFQVGAINYTDYWWVFVLVILALHFMFRRAAVKNVSGKSVGYGGEVSGALGR